MLVRTEIKTMAAAIRRLPRAEPIRHLCGPFPSLAGGTLSSWLPPRSRPAQTSLVAHQFSRVRAVTTTPKERSDANLARFSDRSGLPRYCGEWASAWHFRGLHDVH